LFEGIHWNEQGHRRMAKVLGQLYGSIVSGELKTTSLGSVTPRRFETSDGAEARA
jgi:hypothetical protein